MIVYTVSFTQRGDSLNKKIEAALTDCEIKPFYSRAIRGGLDAFAKEAFNRAEAIIFIGAAGIAVRAVAPYIKSKATDPSVIVCDEAGGYAIPILSGHMGGGNSLALRLGPLIGAEPVITTATDINNIWAADIWAKEKGFKILNPEEIKHISSALLRGEGVGLITDIELKDKLPPYILKGSKETECGVAVSPHIKKPYGHTLNLIPRCVAIGVGSRKNADRNALCVLIEKIFKEYNIEPYSVYKIATIDIKRNEPSVLELCARLSLSPVCFTAEELNGTEGSFNGSEFVRAAVGTDNVCERSALRAVKAGKIIVPKVKGEGVTAALAIGEAAL